MTPRPPLAERFDLRPHPEGGWFRETFRSTTEINPSGYDGKRAAATAIYFALHAGEESAWHVVRSDELWFWHSGGPLSLRLGGDGPVPVEGEVITVGPDHPQALVPAGVWQAAAGTTDAPVLVSCVVAPGFDYADFRLHSDPTLIERVRQVTGWAGRAEGPTRLLKVECTTLNYLSLFTGGTTHVASHRDRPRPRPADRARLRLRHPQLGRSPGRLP